MYCAQNRWTARVYGSAGRMAGAAEDDQASSTYWTMTRDSEMGLPWWSRTGIFLCTGLDLSSSSLFLPTCSSTNSYSTPFSFSAIRTRMTNGLGHRPITRTADASADIVVGVLWLK